MGADAKANTMDAPQNVAKRARATVRLLTYSLTTVRQWESRLSSLAEGLVPGTHLRSSREVAAGSIRMSSPISRSKLCISLAG